MFNINLMAMVSCECVHNAILLFLTFAANKSTTSSRERLSNNFLSIDITDKLLAHCVNIVDLKYDLICSSAEKDCSHSAVLTTVVSKSCRSLTKLRNAALKGMTAASMLLMISNSYPLSAKVRLASTHSILSRSLSIKPYDSTNGTSSSISRNSQDKRRTAAMYCFHQASIFIVKPFLPQIVYYLK